MSARRSRFQVKPNTRSNSSLSKNTPSATEQKKNEEKANPSDVKDKNPNTTLKTNEITTKECGVEITEKESSVTPKESPKDSSSKPIGSDCTPESKVKPPVVRARLSKPKPKIVPRATNSQSKVSDKVSEPPVTKEADSSTPSRVSNAISPMNVTNKTSTVQPNVVPDVILHKSSEDENEITVENSSASEVDLSEKGDESVSETIDRSLLMTSFPVVEASTSSRPHTTLKEIVPVKAKRKPPRRFKPGSVTPEKKSMKMGDLIFWNPLGNPMTRKSPVNANRSPANNRNIAEERDSVNEEEETIDNPDNIPATPQPEKNAEAALPGPRVIIGEDGQITIDESSLVIEQTPTGEDISTQEIVYDASDTTYASFKKPKEKMKSFWTLKETAKFYKTLSIVGTDFTLMSNLFPGRSRIDLKNKFKKEERLRKILVDKAIREWHNFDLNDVESFLAEDTLEQALILVDNAKDKKKKKRKSAVEENEDEVTVTKRTRKKKNLENPKTKKSIPKGRSNTIESDSTDKSDSEQCALTDNNEINSKITMINTPDPSLIEVSTENDSTIRIPRHGSSSNELDNVERLEIEQDDRILGSPVFISTPLNKRTRTLSESTLEYGSPQSVRLKKVKPVEKDAEESYASDSTVEIRPSPKSSFLHSTENSPYSLTKVNTGVEITPNIMVTNTTSNRSLTVDINTKRLSENRVNKESNTNPAHGENSSIVIALITDETQNNTVLDSTQNSVDISTNLDKTKSLRGNEESNSNPQDNSLTTDAISTLKEANPMRENISDDESNPSNYSSGIPSPENIISIGDGSKWLKRKATDSSNEENIDKNPDSKKDGNELTTNHPTLQSLLNQTNENADTDKTNSPIANVSTTPDVTSTVGRLILVASRTPTNEQVVHVYIMSPNDENNATRAANIDNPSCNDEKNNLQTQQPVHSETPNIQPEASTSGINSKNTLENLGIVALDSP